MKTIILIVCYIYPFTILSQNMDYPFNYAVSSLTIKKLQEQLSLNSSLFDEYNPEQKQILLTNTSTFWKSLNIWHFESEIVRALFVFNEENKLKSIRFSSTSLAEIHNDNQTSIEESYFSEYGIPVITYLKKSGWKLKNNPTTFPFVMTQKNQTLTIKINTLYDVAINPESDQFSGFHYEYPPDHIPTSAKYLYFQLDLN